MKRIQSILYLATMTVGMLSVASCSSEDEVTDYGKQVPLEIQVSGVQQTTRSIVEGTTLPGGCEYGIFAMNEYYAINDGINVRVSYDKGISTLNKNVYLPSGMDVTVYAYYPYNANYASTDYALKMPIEITTQTDYLYGRSVDGNNNYAFVNTAQPKANIHFRHALARVTMRIKKSAKNENLYKFPYISLLNVDKSCYFSVWDGGGISDVSGTTNLTAKPSNYGLDDAESEIVVDFLVIPGITEGKNITLNMGDNISNFENGLSAAVPATNWLAGQQYTYAVTINNNVLDVSPAEISPWENNEQGGIEVGDDNYGLAVGGTVAEAVDLGLSVKWASWNVGASAPEGYGGLYFWGDSTGKITTSNENFIYQGNISGTEYDIARKQWGENWRLPTNTELEELKSSCEWVLTEQEGITGYRVTAQNNNSIFLPLAGYAEKESLERTRSGSLGYYWSGSWISNNCSINITLSSDSQHVIDDGYPYKAYSVRPVRK